LIKLLAAHDKSFSAVGINSSSDEKLAVEALNAGAVSIIEPSSELWLPLAAIIDAIRGIGTITRLLGEAADLTAGLRALSVRERDVLARTAQGLSTKEIANGLGLSPKSVETYRSRLMEKLGANSSAMLMRMALLATLVGP
jgi:two-component system response regulator FixJ